MPSRSDLRPGYNARRVTAQTGASVRMLVRHPGTQLVAGGLLLALAFPGQVAGSIGTMILVGGATIGAAWLWSRLPERYRSVRPRVATALVLAAVAMLVLDTFWDTLRSSPDWQMGDWGPQHAVLAHAIDAFPGLDMPVWNHAVSTGDAPFELYPRFTYLLVGNFATLVGLEYDLPHAYMIFAVLVHLGLCLGTTAIAMRVAPRPIAFVCGAMCVVESGAVSEGGPVDLFRWALLHSAVALAWFLVAALGVLSLLARPRMRAVYAIWGGTFVAVIAHPAGLIVAVAAGLSLIGVALLATDVPARRPLLAAGHIGLGVIAGAFVWVPLAERILAYGQHFPNRVFAAADILRGLLHDAWPTTAFGILVFAGYFGIIMMLWSRRAVAIFIAAMALLLLVGTTDAPYMMLDLAGQGLARLGTVRLTSLARPFLAACGAFTFALVIAQAAKGWRAAPPQRRLVGLAIAGILAGGALRELPTVWRTLSDSAFSTTRELAPDRAGRDRLTEWARQRAAELKPDAWGRALFETDTHEHFHLTAITGLPTFHLPPQPDLLLRERIEDTTPESLRRFNVRWVVAQGTSPELGDPATEIELGTYRIREVAGWDGAFARIERGEGTVRTMRLDDVAVEIEVVGTAPVLVALGMGHYPRWVAHDASGASVPVYALPATPDGKLHVVAAWVMPGTTTFTCDGPLPSDGHGTVSTILALLVMVGGGIAWRLRRAAILRRVALIRQRLHPCSSIAPKLAVPLVLVLVFARGCLDTLEPMAAFELGAGLRGSATVEARLADGPWEVCSYSRLSANYICPELLVVSDGFANLLNDAPPSWGFSTPAIVASAHVPGVEMRITREARVSGRYWLATSGESVAVSAGSEPPHELRRGTVDFAEAGTRLVTVQAHVPTTTWSFTLVRETALVPPRPHLDPPPAVAPQR